MLEEPNKNWFDLKKDSSLKSSYDKYKTLFEQVDAAAFLTNLDGNIMEANLKSCELFGYDWDEFATMSLKDILAESIDWDQLMDEMAAKGGINFETENIKKDRVCFPTEFTTSLFMLEGSPVMLVLIRDITERKKAEDALKNSEERYRGMFENSAVAIMLTDGHGRIISWNKYAEKMFGMTEEEMHFKKVEMLYPPGEWTKISSEIVRQKGMKHHIETEMYRKNKELFDVDISLSVFKKECGERSGTIGIIKDISEQKKAQRKLKESEEKYSGLFESTTDGMIVLDARGEILDVNACVLKLFDLKKQQIIGKNFLSMDILTPTSLLLVVKQFGDLLTKKSTKSCETEMQNSKGKILNVEISSFFLVKGENEIDNFVLVLRNISDRKQTEIKLAREHNLLQTLLDNIPDSVYFKDENNKFVMVNKAKAVHSHVTPEEMIGKTDFDFLPEVQARHSSEDDEEILRTGKYIINKLERITNVDGNERWVNITKVPRFDSSGNIVGTAGISRDVTEFKRLEKMNRKIE